MKIIKIEDIKGTEREVHFNCGMISNRILLESDGMGFTLTKTEIPAGDWRRWYYKKHLESCYCVSGKGVINDIWAGAYHNIEPGTTYVLDKHDDHRFKAETDVVLICVFNPPLTGQEVHQKDGSYKVESSYRKNAIWRLGR